MNEPPPSYAFKLNQTKTENDYLLTIIAISQYQINPKGLEWWLEDQSDFRLYNNHFPYLSGESGSTTDENITVTWFDNDKDKKLSDVTYLEIKSNIDFDLSVFNK